MALWKCEAAAVPIFYKIHLAATFTTSNIKYIFKEYYIQVIEMLKR